MLRKPFSSAMVTVITPSTARLIEQLSGGQTFKSEDLSNPDINIRYGTFYLRYLLDKFDDVRAVANRLPYVSGF